MNSLSKTIILSGLVLLLSACAYYPNQYGSYPSDDSYYPQSNYPYSYPGNYQGNQPGYWNQGRPYNNHHDHGHNHNYQYNRPQPRSYSRPERGEVAPAVRPYPKPDRLYNHRELPPAARPYPPGLGR